jgi:nucleoside-diphosphate-sugar epimerase
MPPLLQADLDDILSRTSRLWDEVRDQHIFLTGGTGFFGTWLTESFLHVNRDLSLDAKLTVLTRDPGRFRKKCPHLATDPALTLLQGDVRTFAFPDGEFSHLIHAATESSGTQGTERSFDMLTTIVDGTGRALEFARTRGVRKMLLTSSGAVYGKQPAGLTHVPEDYLGGPDPLDPASVYAEGKRVSEQMCALLAANGPIEIKIARCFAFVGPHLPLDAHFAIGNFIGDVLAGRPIKIRGDGTARRSYLYASDLVVWLWTMLFQAPSLVPVNVGSADDLSILDLAQTVVESLGVPTDIEVAKTPTLGASVARYVPSVERAKEVLGLAQTVGLQEAIRRTANWHLALNID